MNPSLLAATVLFTILALGSTQAQHHPAPGASTYRGFEKRAVKALSDQHIADLRAGRGAGLALPAELNGYPGPLHVLELADRLTLSNAQRASVRQLHESMRTEVIPIGERLVAQETELDKAFATKTITPASLVAATDATARTQAALRAAHLGYHLSTAEALTPDQIHRYGELRGYAGPK